VGDTVSGEALPVGDPRLETVEFYKVSNLKDTMYTPTGTNAEGYHEIKVEVDKTNLKVRSRPGYFMESPER
jgi:hypothetical protein